MSVQLIDGDASDAALVRHVHPDDWQAPPPADRYNLVVIGGGPAGLIAALGAAGLGAKVALVERHLLGGDCLNGGCVPSKAILRASHLARASQGAEDFGVTVQVQTDFNRAMERLRRVRAAIGVHDAAARLRDEGIDVFLGHARFTGADTVEVNGTTLRFARCCVATGARPALPPIPGLAEAEPLTNETLFTLTEAPQRLLILGAGVIGCEMAQAFRGFGTEVVLVDQSDRVLAREDAEAAAQLQQTLEREGVELRLGTGIREVQRVDGRARVVLEDGSILEGDALLAALGRSPNVDLDLDAAGVTHTRKGVQVDDFLRTSNPRIYAAGDVIGKVQLTHAADHQARIVVQNALFFGRRRASALVLPRVVYTAPEVASVGLSADEADADPSLTPFTTALSETDRGRTDGVEGFLRVWADGSGRIRGASAVGPGAGELLAPVTLAMTHGIKLSQVASTVHAYPTLSEAFFKVASAYNRTRLTGWMQRLLRWVLSWRR